MPQAIWNDVVIAESEHTVVVEGNHYFPANSVSSAFLQESETQTECSWKGTAHYYDIVVNGEIYRDAAWYYPSPKPAAIQISGRIAFWKGVQVTD